MNMKTSSHRAISYAGEITLRSVIFVLSFCASAFMPFSFRLSARTVSPQEAKAKLLGSEFLKKAPAGSPADRIDLLHTVEASGLPAIYLFSKNDDGFYVVSADDRTELVLGYGEKILSDISDVPPALNCLLAEYAREIEQARRQDPSGKTVRRISPARNPIAPLMTTKWGQGVPYNDLCPEIDSRHALTGCVATAMAQIMNYHRHPTAAADSDCAFDWANMLDTYDENSTTTQIQAVAQLMEACGNAVNTNYGLGESCASDWDAGKALIEKFGYNGNIECLIQNCYEPARWNDIVYAQLTQYGPVMYSGGAHAFVIDGYSADDYFHINWGWAGYMDGYFKLYALDPDSRSQAGYAADGRIIANISPETVETDYSSAITCEKGLTVPSKPCALGSSVKIGYRFRHNGYRDVSATVGFRIVGSAADETMLNSDDGARRFAPASGPDYVSLTLPADFAEGNYRVYPVFTAGGATHPMPVCMDGNQYLELSVSDGNATFKAAGRPDISFKSLTLKSQFYRNRKVTFDYTVENTSDIGVCKRFCAAIFNSSFTSVLATGNTVCVTLDAGASVSGEYSSVLNTYPEAGSYYFGVYNPETNKVYAYMPIQLQDEPSSSITAEALTVFDAADGVNPEQVKFSMTLRCTEGEYSDVLYAYVFKEGENSSDWNYVLPEVSLSAGETVTREATIDLTTGNLDYNARYFLALVRPGITSPLAVSSLFAIAEKVPSAADAVTVQEAPVSEEIFTLDGRRALGREPGRVYIVLHRYSDGRVTARRVATDR